MNFIPRTINKIRAQIGKVLLRKMRKLTKIQENSSVQIFLKSAHCRLSQVFLKHISQSTHQEKKMGNKTGWSFQEWVFIKTSPDVRLLDVEVFWLKGVDRLGFQRVSRKPFSSSLDYLLEYNTSRSNHFSNQPLIMKDWWLGVKSFDYEESSSYPKRRDPLIGEHLSSDLKLKQSL